MNANSKTTGEKARNSGNSARMFSAKDIKNVKALIDAFKGNGRNLDQWLAKQIGSQDQEGFNTFLLGKLKEEEAKKFLATSLNVVISGELIFEPKVFEGIKLRWITKKFVRDPSEVESMAKINRLLIEDAFGKEIIEESNFHYPDTAWTKVLYPAQSVWRIKKSDILDIDELQVLINESNDIIVTNLLEGIPQESRSWFKSMPKVSVSDSQGEGNQWFDLFNQAIRRKLLINSSQLEEFKETKGLKINNGLSQLLENAQRKTSEGRKIQLNRWILGECYPLVFKSFFESNEWQTLQAKLFKQYYEPIFETVSKNTAIEDPDAFCSDFFHMKFFCSVVMIADRNKSKFHKLVATALGNYMRDFFRTTPRRDAMGHLASPHPEADSDPLDNISGGNPAAAIAQLADIEIAKDTFRKAAKSYLANIPDEEKDKMRRIMSRSDKGEEDISRTDQAKALKLFYQCLMDEVKLLLDLEKADFETIKAETDELFQIITNLDDPFDPFEEK